MLNIVRKKKKKIPLKKYFKKIYITCCLLLYCLYSYYSICINALFGHYSHILFMSVFLTNNIRLLMIEKNDGF